MCGFDLCTGVYQLIFYVNLIYFNFIKIYVLYNNIKKYIAIVISNSNKRLDIEVMKQIKIKVLNKSNEISWIILSAF
jgi:hypothetical protein